MHFVSQDTLVPVPVVLSTRLGLLCRCFRDVIMLNVKYWTFPVELTARSVIHIILVMFN